MSRTPAAAILTNTMGLRVFLVDDNAQFLEAARRLLEQQDVTVEAAVMTSAEALEVSDELDPGVVALVDVDLGEESGLELAERLTCAPDGGPGRTVVFISTFAEEDLTDLVDASPAAGFVSKGDLSGAALVALLARTGHQGTGDWA